MLTVKFAIQNGTGVRHTKPNSYNANLMTVYDLSIMTLNASNL
jgi:hypothetical protein